MSFPNSPYLLNVALHAAVLSVSAWVILIVLRRASYRSVAAVAGLISIAFLPWISALRPFHPDLNDRVAIQSAPLPSWTVATLRDITPEPLETAHPMRAELAYAPRKREMPNAMTFLAVTWLAGTIIGLCMIGIAWLRVRRWRKSLSLMDETNWSALQSLVPEIPCREQFRVSAVSTSPCLVGIRKPRIVLPGFLFEAPSRSGLCWAVRHELAHRKGGDSRWMMVFTLIRCIYWWNPFVHRLVARWAEAREQICDLEATWDSVDRSAYGEFLVGMARTLTTRPPLTIAMAKRPHVPRLKCRILVLLAADPQASRPAGLRFTASSIVVAVLLAGVTSGLRIGATEPAQETMPDVSGRGEIDVDPKKIASIRVFTRLVFSTTKPTMRNGAIFRDGELDSYIESATKQGSTVGVGGESVELGREKSLFMHQSYDRTTGTSNWRGGQSWGLFGEVPLRNFTEFKLLATYEDDRTQLEIKGRYAFIPGSGFPSPDKIPYELNETRAYRYKEADASAKLKIGEAVCTDFGEVEPGVFLQCFAMVVPQTSDRRDAGKYSGNIIRHPSAEVKGRVRLSGVRISIPIEEKLSFEEQFPLADKLTYPIPGNTKDFWKDVVFSKIQELPPVEFPLNELRTPWPSLPGFEIKVIASEDYKRFGITAKPADDAADREERTIETLPNNLDLTFALRSAEPKERARVFFKVEVIR